MKRNIELYIGGQLVELSDTSLILMNYTHEDLTNPTIMKNSYTQQITIDGTPNNDKLFGGIWRFDRVTTGSGGVGINFDANKKTPFAIFSNSVCLESGYMKLDNIAINGEKKQYKVSLYGGLGSFLQALTYNAEGEKRSLADCVFSKVLSFVINKATIEDAWEALNTSPTGTKWDIINFAPCYNGIPDKFDADKMIVEASSYPLLRYTHSETTTEGEEEVTTNYGTKGGYVLMKMNEKIDEWAAQELRSYLQRPIVRVKHLINAIVGIASDYEVTLNEEFFTDQNEYWEKSWMTLPMLTEIASEGDEYPRSGATITQEMLLKSDKTPADYLISFCKMFGLYIVVDDYAKEVEILPRNKMFDRSTILDIEGNVDLSKGLSVTPLPYVSKFYTMGQETKGEFADKYAATNVAPFGTMRINTGYEFSNEEKALLSSLAFKGGVEIAENGRFFANYGTTIEDVDYQIPPFILLGGTYTLYAGSGDTYDMDIVYPRALVTGVYMNADYPGYDALPKVQFHEKDNKSIDGKDVLLFYQGYREYIQEIYENFRITDDITAMDTLNEGVPCWYWYDETSFVQRVPLFGRYIKNGGEIVRSWDFGTPAELAVPGLTPGQESNIYEQYWQRYIQDRFDDDTKVLKCWLNMRGLPQGGDLLRRFVYFQGAIWCVNKVINHSITSEEVTEVELIKVQNIQNYI